MAETYYLKLMGIPELRRPDGRPLKLKVRKHLALLVYLVMDERPVHLRDELAELLWPGVPEENSRHSLSMAFTVLRGIFGAECLTGNHAEIRFRPPRLVRDLDRLEAGELLAEAGQPSLEVDGFLRGFHIEDAPQFQHWRDRRHAQLLPLIQAALLTLVDQARRSADLPGMLALADRLLVLDPLAEEAVRARMEALALQGDRVSALRAYEAWREELERELGARPSEPLRGMAERLRRGMETRPSRFAISGGEGRLAAPRLVGRAAEYGVLWEAWERTTQYNTRHVLLGGETGVGKSTLAMRFAAAAELEGAAVARVQCFELEQRMAFGMIGALITSLLERPGALATAPEALAEVARMVPKVRERLRGLPAPRPAEGEAARLHFAEGTLALLDSILEEQPVLLIVDDYPRSDEASLSVLHLVLRRAVQQRLMVVLLGRPPESDESPQAARLRQAGNYLPLDRIELGVLPEPDSDELLSGLLLGASRQPASPERRALLRTAGGNPMALELLTQDWLTHGDAALAVLLPAMGDDVPASALEAAGYDRLIERMLPAMTPRTRMALYLAAILGPRLNELECFEVLEFSPVQTIAALSELVQQRLLRDTGRGLEFVNELIRARLYLKIPTAARVRLHYGVAERLLAAVAAGTAVPGLEIAWHCIRARRREEATPFLLTGARDAITHGAPDEAARALSSAVGQLKGSAKAEATLLLAETYQEMGAWGDALVRLCKLSALEKSNPVIQECVDVFSIESKRHMNSYRITEYPRLLEGLIRTIRYGLSPLARIRAGLTAASMGADLRHVGINQEARKAIACVGMEGLDSLQRGKVLLARAMTYYHHREGDKGFQQVSEASRAAIEAGATDTTQVLINMGIAAIAAADGAYDKGVTHFSIAYKTAARLDNEPLMTQAANNLALCYSRLGPIERHRYWAEMAWHHARSSKPGSIDRINSTAQRGLIAAWGPCRSARAALQTLQEETTYATLLWLTQAAHLFAADIAFFLGDEPGALRAASEACQISPSAISIGFAGKFARWKTVLLLRQNRPLEAWSELQSQKKRIERLDRIDRVEVLSSLALAGRALGYSVNALEAQVRGVLATLPIACTTYLQRLGLFLPN